MKKSPSANIRKAARLRRATKLKFKLKKAAFPKLIIFRSSKHIYGQVVLGGKVLACASSLESDIKSHGTGNIDSSKRVGQLIASRAIEKGISQVVFDRRGYLYHGRVREFAEAAREAGLTI